MMGHSAIAVRDAAMKNPWDQGVFRFQGALH